jgi:hypothetical protein
MKIWLLAGLLALGCDDGTSAVAVDGGADAQVGDAMLGDAAPDAAVEEVGATARFDPTFDQADPEAFYDFPYPSDLRLDAQGHPRLQALPNPNEVALIQGIFDTASDRRGFPTLPVAWFRFDAPLVELTRDTLHWGDDAQLLLLNVDPDSAELGQRVPVVAQTLAPDSYVPEHVLAVAARPGFVLRPETTYAFVVLRGLKDAQGLNLGASPGLLELEQGAGEAAVQRLYAPLWPVLAAQAVPLSAVAAATVFTTGDTVADLYALTEQVRAAHSPELDNLRRMPEADTERFCVLRASVQLPQYQVGVPPFDADGLFAFEDGAPVVQRMEDIPVAVAIPRRAMPAEGWPLTQYFHGSGGESLQFMNAGPLADPPVLGRGPAWVLADKGIASAGSAHPVSPERVPGASETAYLNFKNLAAFRDTFRQGIIEQRLYLDALLALRVPTELLADCDGFSNAGAEVFFNPEALLAQGQSMGGMYTNLIGAVEPRLRALVPTGAGGFWAYFILETSLVPNVRLLLRNLLRAGDGLSFLHPTLHAAETAWEVIDPMVGATRLSRDPLPGHPARSVYEPVGIADSYFPPSIYDAMVLAYGHPQAGEEIWPEMQAALGLRGLDGYLEYPIANNLGPADAPWTGVVVQYALPEGGDGHQVYRQLDAVKYQYGCFFETFLATGTATVPAPAPLGTPCPGL